RTPDFPPVTHTLQSPRPFTQSATRSISAIGYFLKWTSSFSVYATLINVPPASIPTIISAPALSRIPLEKCQIINTHMLKFYHTRLFYGRGLQPDSKSFPALFLFLICN